MANSSNGNNSSSFWNEAIGWLSKITLFQVIRYLVGGLLAWLFTMFITDAFNSSKNLVEITGNVRDRTSDKELDGVEIFINNISFGMTDPKGDFKIELDKSEYPDGSVTLVFDKKGYERKSAKVDFVIKGSLRQKVFLIHE